MAPQKSLFAGLAIGFILGMSLFFALSSWTNPATCNTPHQIQFRRIQLHKPTTAVAKARTTISPKTQPRPVRVTTAAPKKQNVSAMVLPSGLALRTPSFVEVRPDMSPTEAENQFYAFVVQIQVQCNAQKRLGHVEDGGWNICLIPPYTPGTPCLVYSFGINNDWSFDDDVVRRYKCDVRAFDPSMAVGDHRRGSKIMFYKTGISGSNFRNKRGWKLRTLSTLLEESGDSGKIIDYLKMDVEYSEWDSLKAMLKSGVLKRVRQFGFEIHTAELQRRSTTPALFTDYYQVLRQLEAQGFRRWYSHFNRWGKYFSPRTRQQRTCCYELVYINMNFLKSHT